MKKIFAIISAAVLAVSCQMTLELQNETVKGTPVIFHGGVATKTAFASADGAYTNVWADGDQISVYSADASAGANYAYTATPDAENPATCVFAPSEAGRVFCCTEGAQSFYAYYPYEGGAGENPADIRISLPVQQVQEAENSMKHIGGLFAMKAAPAQASGTSTASFEFKGLYALVKLSLKMSGSVKAPIASMKLVSNDAPLAFDEATLDLTSASAVPSITNGSKTVELVFNKEFGINGTEKQAYIVVAPGTHAGLTLVLTATDGSSDAITLPAVTFEANKVYAQSVTVDEKDFGFENPFTAEASNLNCKAGETVTFTMAGVPNTVEFWSGEAPHRWEYRNSGAMDWPDITVSFKTFLQAGAQPTPMKVKYSKDYNGAGTEAAILAATWTDVTSRFKFATDNSVTVTPTNTDNFVSSGVVSMGDVYEADEAVYFGFFYHVDAFVTAQNNGRTQCYLNSLTVNSVYNGEETNLFTESQESLPYIKGASYDGETASNSPSWNATLNSIKFTSAFKPAAEKNAYAVTPAIKRQGVVLSADSGIVIKASDDPMVNTYTYKFEKPGTYNVVLVGNIVTFAGTSQIVKEFKITVN